MALERFWWGPSLGLLRDSRNGALWLEHWLLTGIYNISCLKKIGVILRLLYFYQMKGRQGAKK